MENLVDSAMQWGKLYLPSVIAALTIAILGRIVVAILLGVVGRLMKRAKVDDTLTRFLLSISRIGLMAFVIIAALSALGIETTSVIALLGAAGLAIGFALQSSLGNFASGVMLIMFRPFQAGDYVEAGGTNGVVEEIAIFNTVLRTPDNKKVVVPNGAITGGSIINYSAKEERRVDMVFGIGYGDDIKKAKEVLLRLVSEDGRILADPAPLVAVSELADSSVNFVVRPWVKTADYWDVYFDLTEKVKLTFDQEGISIPFPQQDVHMHQVSAV